MDEADRIAVLVCVCVEGGDGFLTMNGEFDETHVCGGADSRTCRGMDSVPAVEGIVERQFAQLVREQQCVTQRQTRVLGQAE